MAKQQGKKKGKSKKAAKKAQAKSAEDTANGAAAVEAAPAVAMAEEDEESGRGGGSEGPEPIQVSSLRRWFWRRWAGKEEELTPEETLWEERGKQAAETRRMVDSLCSVLARILIADKELRKEVLAGEIFYEMNIWGGLGKAALGLKWEWEKEAGAIGVVSQAALEVGLHRSAWMMEAVDRVLLVCLDFVRIDSPRLVEELERLRRRRAERSWARAKMFKAGSARALDWWEPRLAALDAAYQSQKVLVRDVVTTYDDALLASRRAIRHLLSLQADYHRLAVAALGEAIPRIPHIVLPPDPNDGPLPEDEEIPSQEAAPTQPPLPGISFLAPPEPLAAANDQATQPYSVYSSYKAGPT